MQKQRRKKGCTVLPDKTGCTSFNEFHKKKAIYIKLTSFDAERSILEVDNLKQSANQELSDVGRMLIGIISKYVEEKIQEVNIDELFSKRNEEDLINLWSTQLSFQRVTLKRAYLPIFPSRLGENPRAKSNGIVYVFVVR